MLEAVLNRVPPQNIEAEMSTLGSMMIDRGALEKGLEMLQGADFYRPSHQDVFTALGELAEASEPVDLITLQEQLRKAGNLEDCGGTEYLMALADSVPTAANVEYYAGIVVGKSKLRTLISTAQEIIGIASSEGQVDADELIARAETKILSVAGSANSGKKTALALVHEVWDTLERAKQGTLGPPITFAPLAHHSNVMVPETLTVIGARPSKGKTALLKQVLDGAAATGWPTAVFSLEMSECELLIRDIGRRTKISPRRMFNGELGEHEWGPIGKACNDILLETQLTQIIDADGWNIRQIAARARRLVAEGVKLIGIDYLQLIGRHNPRLDIREHISEVAYACKTIAKSLNIPVILVSQLSRAVEKRDDERPCLGDLRESGAIEDAADVVWLLWRERTLKSAFPPPVENAEINIAKGRNIGTATIKCGFDRRVIQFVDLDAQDEGYDPQGELLGVES